MVIGWRIKELWWAGKEELMKIFVFIAPRYSFIMVVYVNSQTNTFPVLNSPDAVKTRYSLGLWLRRTQFI